MSIQSVISQIVTGAKKVWSEIEADIDADYAAIKNALPASAQPSLAADVAALKQVASDALGVADSGVTTYEHALVTAVEGALDGAMVTATNGAALPLVPAVNVGVSRIAKLVGDTAAGWLLKQQAALAANPAKPAA